MRNINFMPLNSTFIYHKLINICKRLNFFRLQTWFNLYSLYTSINSILILYSLQNLINKILLITCSKYLKYFFNFIVLFLFFINVQICQIFLKWLKRFSSTFSQSTRFITSFKAGTFYLLLFQYIDILLEKLIKI